MSFELGIIETGESMSEILADALKAKNYSKKEFAGKMGWTPQNFGQRLKKNSFTAEEWRKMAGVLGYDLRLVEVESGIEFEGRKKGHGSRVKQVINGVVYDTYKADALCNNFYQDGKNEYIDGMAFELYIDPFSRFFLVQYTEWKNGINSITPISKKEAKIIYKKYSDEPILNAVFFSEKK